MRFAKLNKRPFLLSPPSLLSPPPQKCLKKYPPPGGGLNRGFTVIAVEPLKLQKDLSIAFYPDLHFFLFFEIARIYLRLAGCRVYEGHLQNEWVITTFRKHPKSSKLVCINSSLQFLLNFCPFCRNSKLTRKSSFRFLWNFVQQKTSTQSIGIVKHF